MGNQTQNDTKTKDTELMRNKNSLSDISTDEKCKTETKKDTQHIEQQSKAEEENHSDKRDCSAIKDPIKEYINKEVQQVTAECDIPIDAIESSKQSEDTLEEEYINNSTCGTSFNDKDLNIQRQNQSMDIEKEVPKNIDNIGEKKDQKSDKEKSLQSNEKDVIHDDKNDVH